MALRPWTPDKGFVNEEAKQPASVSTTLSLELCTFPRTLGSSVAAAALEQLLVVECVKDAHRLNILEINQMRTKIERTQNEMEFLNKRISELKEMNEVLGVKQEELAKQHTNFVLWLNQTLEERAAAIIYINDTYAKIKLEKEEIAFQKQCLQETNDLIDKHKTEYLEKKEDLTNQIKEIKQSCETSRKEAYSKKKELTRLQNKIIRMKHTVNSSTLMINDHTLEMARLQESVSIWEKKVEDLKKSCLNLEDKLEQKKRKTRDCDPQSHSGVYPMTLYLYLALSLKYPP
ncbi:hypothetical protein H671_5g13620 [Cricetulus griseus]|uniref:Coiled-coil domain-containing protein 175 n=1 Tax=Cricetulus griseus TaxID=10029 RepID=A0A061I1J5_CRIGR|nr:hypothetical protein H671_5g13620 [Cricetulus griseus]